MDAGVFEGEVVGFLYEIPQQLISSYSFDLSPCNDQHYWVIDAKAQIDELQKALPNCKISSDPTK
jgi:hypothetical protein